MPLSIIAHVSHCLAARRSAPPLDISSLPGFDKLTEREKEVRHIQHGPYFCPIIAQSETIEKYAGFKISFYYV